MSKKSKQSLHLLRMIEALEAINEEASSLIFVHTTGALLNASADEPERVKRLAEEPMQRRRLRSVPWCGRAKVTRHDRPHLALPDRPGPRRARCALRGSPACVAPRAALRDPPCGCAMGAAVVIPATVACILVPGWLAVATPGAVEGGRRRRSGMARQEAPASVASQRAALRSSVAARSAVAVASARKSGGTITTTTTTRTRRCAFRSRRRWRCSASVLQR